MIVKIFKSTPKGELIAPSSKSYSHRYLLAAGLSKNTSTVSGLYFSNDVMASLNCLSSFGCDYILNDDSVTFRNVDKKEVKVFDCNESGSTLRFMIPIALTKYEDVTFKGSEKLISRGIGVYEKMFNETGIEVFKTNDSLRFVGKLKPGTYEIDGSISSQFVSGLLYALPLLDGDSKITLLPPVNSKNYIDMTIEVLEKYSIKIEKEDNALIIPGNQKYIAKDYEVEKDYSNSAFLEAFNYLGGNLKVLGLNPSSLQGDKVYQDYFELLSKGNVTLDISNCIDLGPVLFVFASLHHGATFTGTSRLKIKESDRSLTMKEELAKVGVQVDIYDDKVIVYKDELKEPCGIFNSHNDHRIIMALSLLSTKFDIVISNAEAVSKSYPHYFKELEKVGVKIDYEAR